jgi:hypothetical protein
VTLSGFIRGGFLGLLLSANVHAASVPNAVTVNAVGKELSDAMVAAVRSAVSQNFKNYPGYSKQVLDEEIIPAASQLVSSYKVLEGTDSSSSVNISAVVELSLVRNMLDFAPKSLGISEEDGGTAIVVFRAPNISFLEKNKVTDYYGEFKSLLKQRLERRKFKVVEATEDIKEAGALGDDVSEPGVLRIYGIQNNAEVALGVQITPDAEGRGGWNLKGTLLHVKPGKVLGRFEQGIQSPRYKKETFQTELQRTLNDAGNQLMMAVLSRAGGEAGPSRKDDFLHLKIVNLKNPQLLEKFRTAALGISDIQGLTEFSVRKGAYELAVNTRLGIKQLETKLKALTWEDMEAEIGHGEGLELTVSLTPKVPDKTKEGQ